MQKRFELWLDESGNFKNEKALKENHKNPSLIGGILLEKNIADNIDVDELVDDRHNHAMNFTNEQKREYALPVLEVLKEKYHAREVFFENQTYTDDVTNRQLYLRIMAEGLLRLLQTLNAMWESVLVDVIIAQRQDVEAAEGLDTRIGDAEYIAKLNETMKRKRRMRRIHIDENSELKFKIQPAHTEKKLQMADFACNTRLTRDSLAFAECRERIEALHEDAFIFSLAEAGSDNYIRTSLSQGYVSDAIMELYTSLDTGLDRENLLELVIRRMLNENYRILKAQLKQCSSDIVAYAALQDDYEVGEELFRKIHEELVSLMREKNLPCAHFEFTILLWQSDNYLREGDIVAARACIEQCRDVQKSFGNSLEEIFTYYQLLEKESLLAIDEFNFKKGKDLMHNAGITFSGLMQFLTSDQNICERFPTMKSEYYGDALCMEIYAAMFMQRENPLLYEELCMLSDIAMRQYPDQKGELERHRQYRSRIELEQGNINEAVSYLFLAKEYETDEVNEHTLLEFLELVSSTEQTISCQYYLMYYLLIMNEAERRGCTEISGMMYSMLKKQNKLLQYSGLHTSQNPDMHSIDTQHVKTKKSGVVYHPLEIIHWKYGSYLLMKDRIETAELYFVRAISMCFAHNNYATMEITGFGIWAEYLVCLIKNKEVNAACESYHELMKKIDAVKKQGLHPETLTFINKLAEPIKEANLGKGKLDCQKLIEASRKISY